MAKARAKDVGADSRLRGQRDCSALLTDQYELSMLDAYFAEGLHEIAVFEFFVRSLPRQRNFLIAAGLQQLIDYLEDFRFSPQELEWLEKAQGVPKDFLYYLADLRFTGDVDAMREGTLCFPNEPIVRITAPLPEAQIIETRLINILQLQTMIASKAVRCVLAGKGKVLVDFGARRAHGNEAALLSARASYLAGFDGTSLVLAGKVFGIPTYGTMAHSYIQTHEAEEEAFLAFARANPHNAIFLIDTYDTEAAAAKLVALAPRLEAESIHIAGVRLDSGDLAAHANQVRRILDEGNLFNTKIFVSGGLDENNVQTLAAAAPIDGFGIGTKMNTSADAPYLDCAYKLQEYAGKPRRKRSEGKATFPGRKQVFRLFKDGYMVSDSVTLENEPQEGTPLLVPVMRQGRTLAPLPSLNEVRQNTATGISSLTTEMRTLETAPPYPVSFSKGIRLLVEAGEKPFGVDRRSTS